MSSTEPTKAGGQRPARRTVVKGAAWAVPVVAVASAAPAFAASPKPIDFVGTGCKDPSGGSGSRYFFVLDVSGVPQGAQISFTHTFSESATFTHVDQRPGPFAGAGIINVTAPQVILKFNNPNNAANGTLTIRYTYDNLEYEISTNQYSADCGNRVPPIVPFGNQGPSDGARTDEEPAVEAETSVEVPVQQQEVEESTVAEPTVDTAEVTSAPNPASTDEATEDN